MKISNWGRKKVKRTWIYFRHKRYIEVIFFASVKVLQQFIELKQKKRQPRLSFKKGLIEFINRRMKCRLKRKKLRVLLNSIRQPVQCFQSRIPNARFLMFQIQMSGNHPCLAVGEYD